MKHDKTSIESIKNLKDYKAKTRFKQQPTI